MGNNAGSLSALSDYLFGVFVIVWRPSATRTAFVKQRVWRPSTALLTAAIP
ncbi:MAG: hypothetical protein HXL34_00485 [Prevotellaceae bacterium]|nr:hypothetical protein [Prevotellaceae bacterium]